MVADQIHNGDRHLTLSPSDDSPTFLVPAWMLEPGAATIGIVDTPRLPVARLLELRAFLDSGLASNSRDEPGGGADAKANGEDTAGFFRTNATARQIADASAGAADASAGADPNPVDRSETAKAVTEAGDEQNRL